METGTMLIERSLQIMNFGIVGEAYGIAANFLRKGGLIAESEGVNEDLLEIVIRLFHGGTRNKLRLANQAIARFTADVGG
jgi:hypothetical protein